MDAKLGVDTAENEPSKVLAENSEKSSVSNFPSKVLQRERQPSLPSRPSFKRTAGIKPLRASGLYDPANVPNAEECDIAQPTNCGEPDGPFAGITRTLNELQEKGFERQHVRSVA